MRYQKTHSDDIPELTRLWKQAFGDSDEDIARFFREVEQLAGELKLG